MRVLAAAALGAAIVIGASAPCRAQTTDPVAAAGPALFPEDVSFVVRVDASALARSRLLPQLLRRPEAASGLAQALGRSSTLASVRALYVGFPHTFTPTSTELPVLLVGDFTADEILADLAAAPGVSRKERDGRTWLESTGRVGTTYATALGDGALALGDDASVLSMLEVWQKKRPGADSAPLPAARAGEAADVAGGGRVPGGLREYLQSLGGAGGPLASVDRLAFRGTLGPAVQVQASLHASTAEARQAIQQALGALVMFGPSRYANDPEKLSAIQSLRFAIGGETVDVSATLPRSLLLSLF